MRTSRNLKGQPGKLKERQGAPTGYYYYILQLRRVGLRLYRSSFPELSLPEGAGGAEAAARRNSARLKIKGWVQSYFVQKPIKAHLLIQSNLVIRNGLIRNKLVLRNHFL